jgi:hypothetical protein
MASRFIRSAPSRSAALSLIALAAIMAGVATAGETRSNASASTLQKTPGAEAAAGVTFLPLGSAACRQMQSSSPLSGVFVGSIAPGGSPLQLCDLILGIDGEAVQSPGQMASRLHDAVRSGQSSVLLLIDRRGGKSYVALKLPAS